MIRTLNQGKNGFYPNPQRFRRQVRTSYSFVLVLALLAAYAAFGNALQHAPISTAISLAALFSYGIVALLHRHEHHTLARVTLICTSNLAIFAGCFFEHPAGNLSMILLAFVGIPFIIMSWRENRAIVLSLALLPVVLWNIVHLTQFADLKYIEISADQARLHGFAHATFVFIAVAVEFAYYDWVTQNYSRALQASLAAEERNGKAKTVFLSTMSHELRTPLSAVLGAAELLSQHPEATQDIRRLSNMILDGGNNILDLGEKAISYARASSGPIEPNFIQLEPMQHIMPIIEKFHDKIEKKQLSIKTRQSAYRLIWADPILFSETISQVLENAIKYAPDKSEIRLTVSSSTGDMLRITIADNGPGIPAQQQQEVFEPFNRLDQKFGTKSGGGIGLTIAKAYVDAMHGRIGFCPTAKTGTCLWIEMPLSSRTDPAAV
ncbi:MAG: HAMP domain-containing histidine kinase [Thalassovita sp.]